MGIVGGEKADVEGVMDGADCTLLDAGCRGLEGLMGGRTGTPSPGRPMAGWLWGILAIILLAL